MSRKFARQMREEEWEFELPISMIDVVFLLLIFFMCASKFRSIEKRLDADLPKDEGQNPIPKKVEPPSEIRVQIFWENSAGQVISSPIFGDPSDIVRGQPLSVAGARIRLQCNRVTIRDLNELARTLGDLTSRNPSMPVIIDARQKVPFKWVIGAIDACARAEVRNVKFQAPPVEGGGGDDWWWK